jgi:hypothetical protein
MKEPHLIKPLLAIKNREMFPREHFCRELAWSLQIEETRDPEE